MYSILSCKLMDALTWIPLLFLQRPALRGIQALGLASRPTRAKQLTMPPQVRVAILFISLTNRVNLDSTP